MHTLRYLLILISLIIYNGHAFSQTIEGLKDIVSFQQEKISRIEDNLKDLIGLIEDQSIRNNKNNNFKIIENQISTITEKLRLFDNKLKNITNLTYDLDFALKRIERHLQLSSIKSDNNKTNDNASRDEINNILKKKPDINMKSLDPKTTGVLGFIKEANPKVNKSDTPTADKQLQNNEKVSLLPAGTSEENYNYALDLASQLDFINAEKVFKEFLIVHKDSSKIADAQYWLGRVYFAQKKFEEAAIALA